jgi:hypothetical protein
MASELERWAVAERQFLKDEIKWLKAGAMLTSPSGADVTTKKLEELKSRLEHANIALGSQSDA